jgi:hypothetical protein
MRYGMPGGRSTVKTIKIATKANVATGLAWFRRLFSDMSVHRVDICRS